MTPPPAAIQAAQPRSVAFEPVRRELSGVPARLLGAGTWSRLRLLVDVAVLCVASVAALISAKSVTGDAASYGLAAAFTITVLAVLYGRRGPDDRLLGSSLDTGVHILGVVSLAAMLTTGAGSMLGLGHPVELALRLGLFALVGLGVARILLLSVRRQALNSGALATPTLIVGAGAVGQHLVKRLVGEPRYGLRPVGFLDAAPPPRSDRSDAPFVPVLGGARDLEDAAGRTAARHVILAFSSAESDETLAETVRECQRLGIEVSLVPRLPESINERTTLDHVGGLPLLSLRPTNPRSWRFALKHGFDRTVAFIALVALAPVLMAIAVAVRLTSSGPVLFRQRRVGRDGCVFDVLKFRTMRESTERPEFELPEGSAPGGIEGQDRRTRIGRLLRDTSLDELPQLINVLRGDMSLVGPRPERPEFVARFAREVSGYRHRHRVKSGITGWAQVNGLRGQTSIADRAEWDNHYIQNWSLRFDLRILVLTVVEVLRLRDNA